MRKLKPILVSEATVAANPQRYIVEKGQKIVLSEIPEAVREWILPRLTDLAIHEEYPLEGVSTNFCTIMSSAPAINPLNGSIAMPQFAFGSQDTVPIPEQQFLSMPELPNHFYIGLVLSDKIPALTLDSVRIITRVPLDKEKYKPTPDLLNKVPVPIKYQIFGTRDILTPGKNPNSLTWVPMTGPMQITSSDWNFISPTSFRFTNNRQPDTEPEKRRFHGFKLQVFEWDSTNASPDDMLTGISRIKFVFDEAELAALAEEHLVLPKHDTPAGYVFAHDLESLVFEDSETFADTETGAVASAPIEEPSAPAIEPEPVEVETVEMVETSTGSDEEITQEGLEDLIFQAVNKVLEENFGSLSRDLKLQTTEAKDAVTGIQVRTAEILHEFEARVQKIRELFAEREAALIGHGENIDALIATFKHLSEEIKGRLDQDSVEPSADYVKLDEQLKALVSKVEELSGNKATTFDPAVLEKILSRLDALESSTAAEKESSMNPELIAEMAAAVGTTSTVIKNIFNCFRRYNKPPLSGESSKVYLALVDKGYGPDSFAPATLERPAAPQQKDRQELAEAEAIAMGPPLGQESTPIMLGTTHYVDPSYIDNQWITMDSPGRSNADIVMVLPAEAEIGDKFTITHLRLKGGKTTITGNGNTITIVEGGQVYPDNAEVSLTVPGEVLTLIFDGEVWIGRV